MVENNAYTHGRKWWWSHKETRLVDNDWNILVGLVNSESLTILCNQMNLDVKQIDWKDTGTVVNNKYIPLASKKNRLQRIFERSYLHGYMMRRGLY